MNDPTRRVALHVKILVGLVLGTFGGATANLLWHGSNKLDWVDTFAPQASASVPAVGEDLTIDTVVDIVPRSPLEAAASGELILRHLVFS